MAKKETRVHRKRGRKRVETDEPRPTISRVDLLVAVFECGLREAKGWFNWEKFLKAEACRHLSPAERKELRARVFDTFVAYHDALARKPRNVNCRKASHRGD